MSTSPVGKWPPKDDKEFWFMNALASPLRSDSEKLFITRLRSMGVSFEDIFNINLERKRALLRREQHST